MGLRTWYVSDLGVGGDCFDPWRRFRFWAGEGHHTLLRGGGGEYVHRRPRRLARVNTGINATGLYQVRGLTRLKLPDLGDWVRAWDELR